MKTALLVIACIVLTAQPSAAEWLADVYAGLSFTQDHDITVKDPVSGRAEYRDIEFNTGLTYGARFGRYFDAVPFLGLAVDFFNLTSNIGPQSVRVDGCVPSGGCGSNTIGFGSYDVSSIALSVDVLLRLPLGKTEDMPGGRFQPYVLAGAPLFITSVTPRNTQLFRNADGDTDVSLGYKLGAGLAVYVFKNLMVFGEYRFTHAEPEVELRNAAARKATFRTELDSQTVLGGVSVRW